MAAPLPYITKVHDIGEKGEKKYNFVDCTLITIRVIRTHVVKLAGLPSMKVPI